MAIEKLLLVCATGGSCSATFRKAFRSDQFSQATNVDNMGLTLHLSTIEGISQTPLFVAVLSYCSFSDVGGTYHEVSLAFDWYCSHKTGIDRRPHSARVKLLAASTHDDLHVPEVRV